MSSLLQHPQFGEIRVQKAGDNFLFCAKDVCEVLDLAGKGSHNLSPLDDDEKILLKIDTNGGKQDMWFVTESGLYTLIIRSNKSEARKFRKWITSEVLPSLRKYGTYSLDEKVMDRVRRKAEEKAIKAFHSEIKRRLSETDIMLVARQCRTTKFDVYDVLSGETEDPCMMAILYGRAIGNKVFSKCFYTQKGVEILLKELMSDK